MRERPILFSAPMVRALLAGTKTQTRRAVKWRGLPAGLNLGFSGLQASGYPEGWVLQSRGRQFSCWQERTKPTPCPYGVPGDRLRVKEAAWMWCERRPNGTTATGRPKWLYVPMRESPLHYVADHPARPQVSVVSPDTGNLWGWRLKIGRFLPAWASRITLEVTGVRVERLQEISEADAAAEGCLCYVCGRTMDGKSEDDCLQPRASLTRRMPWGSGRPQGTRATSRRRTRRL